jgi:hypothetical protein
LKPRIDKAFQLLFPFEQGSRLNAHISLNGDRTHIPKAITLSLHPQKAIANITKSSANSKQKPLKHLPPKP